MLKQQQKANKETNKKSVRANFQFHTLSLAYITSGNSDKRRKKKKKKNKQQKGRAEAK